MSKKAPAAVVDKNEDVSSEVAEEFFPQRSDTMPPPPMKGRFGKGYVTDKSIGHDKSKDPTHRHHLGASTGELKEASLAQFVGTVRNQRQTSSCTGFAFGMAAYVRLLKIAQDIGRDPNTIPWPSPTAIYDAGIAADRVEGESLVDEGAAPSQVVRGMATQGIPADVKWPPGGFDATYDKVGPGFITDEPDLAELEAASTFVLQGFFRIEDGTDETVLGVKQALAAGYPVAVGVDVDQAFEDHIGPSVVGPCGPNPLGGHMLCVVGYRTNAKGLAEFQVVNSWGPSWGDRGFFWASAAWLKTASDCYAITVTPK